MAHTIPDEGEGVPARGPAASTNGMAGSSQERVQNGRMNAPASPLPPVQTSSRAGSRGVLRIAPEVRSA
ncbi:MAG: hypothetical protein AO394_00155 [Candidatus Fermentibacter daniensis]|nr:MAG: hypothetical protein AO394_00155 [Candidatus Fermentibacter daniensis]